MISAGREKVLKNHFGAVKYKIKLSLSSCNNHSLDDLNDSPGNLLGIGVVVVVVVVGTVVVVVVVVVAAAAIIGSADDSSSSSSSSSSSFNASCVCLMKASHFPGANNGPGMQNLKVFISHKIV